MADLKFKVKVRAQAGLALPVETVERALILDANGEVKSSAVTSTELGYVSGVTSSIQTQINDVDTAVTNAQQAIDDHLADTVDAHDASAISTVPAGNLAATDVQAALDELQSDVDTRIPSSEKGAANGVASLDANGKVPSSQLPNAIMEYQGVYNASTNTPTLANGAGNADEAIGNVYRVTVAGTVDFGAGNITFEVGDYVILNSDKIWEKSDTTDAVATVFGRIGNVVAESGDYTASQVTNVPSGNLAATDVQAALDELQSDVDTRALATDLTDHLNDTTDAHDASAISVVPAGNLASTDVQAALEELQGDIDSLASASAGDIEETSFALADNQSTPANVTGFLFNPAVVRSFSALISVEVDATLDLFETFQIIGIQKAGSFDIAVSAVGDESGVVFSITSGGQIQYTSASYAGFVSGSIKFRAITTSL